MSAQKHFRASDTGGKMSAVETSDYVRDEYFVGASLELDSVGAQLAELCPACVGGTSRDSEGSAAAPFVAVLVSSSEVRSCHRTPCALSVPFPLLPARARAQPNSGPGGGAVLWLEAVESALKRLATRSAEGRCTRASRKSAKATRW